MNVLFQNIAKVVSIINAYYISYKEVAVHDIIHRLLMSNNGQHTTSSPPLRKMIENYSYTPKDRLGSGYSSEVFRGCHQLSGEAVAVKVVNLAKVREKGVEEMLKREIKLLREVSHRNVIACRDVLMTANNCYIVTEFCPQGDLAALLAKKGRLPEEEALSLLLHICRGLVYLHAEGVMHRDIKPQNILLGGQCAKIGDLGFAYRSQVPRREGYTIGSPLYMSPQALNRREYSVKTDLWAFGITMFQVLEGRPPWNANNQRDLKQLIKGELKFKIVECAQLQEIIKGCLRNDPNTRFTAADVLSKLELVKSMRSVTVWSVQDKQNNQGGNNGVREQGEQVKKAMRNNYNLLKWLINYSRFSAKLLPRIQEHLQCEDHVKQPFVELTARLLHLTISKLNRVEEVHHQLSLSHFAIFKRTTRFAKIQAVTAEYHQRYLLLLTRLPYRYHLGTSLHIDLPAGFLQNLQKVNMSAQCTQEHLATIDFLITLAHVASQSKHSTVHSMPSLVDFQKLVESSPPHYCSTKVGELIQRRARVAQAISNRLSL